MPDARSCFCLAFLLLFLAAQPVLGADEDALLLLESSRSQALFEDAHAALLDFRLDRAEERLEQLGGRPDGRFAAQHYLATIALYRGLMTDKEAHFESFYEHSDVLRESLEEAPESVWRAFLWAESDLQRAIAAVKTGRFMRAAMAGRSAYNHYEELQSTYGGDVPDAGLGQGILFVSVASLPGSFRRLLSFLGFSGTMQEGLSQLRRAAEHGQVNREQARIALGLLDITVNQAPEEGLRYIEPLYEQRPESHFYEYLYGFALLENRRGEEAEAVLGQGMQRMQDPEYFFIHYVECFYADALFRQNEFGEAQTHYRRYLARHAGPAMRAEANLRLGLSLEMMGRRDEAETFYRRVRPVRDFDGDLVAHRHAQKYLQQPLTELQRELLHGINAYDAGRYEEAEEILLSVHSSAPEGSPERGEAAYQLGRLYHAQDQWDEAVPVYQYAAEHPGEEEAKWGPWSHFYLGKIYAARGQHDEARAAYEQALSRDGSFDYQQALEQSVRAAREELQ